MEHVTSNLRNKVHREQLNGRSYLVAPVTLIVPGVLNGSNGPLYYPPEEVASEPWKWNGIPLILRHPARGSARTPSVLNSQSLGYVFGVVYTNKLVGEAWFDEILTQERDPNTYNKVLRGERVEVSTGLGTKNEKSSGIYNSPKGRRVAYTAIARNYKPDHLAVLPDQVGACSLQDGCGVNNKERTMPQSKQESTENYSPSQPRDGNGRWSGGGGAGGGMAPDKGGAFGGSGKKGKEDTVESLKKKEASLIRKMEALEEQEEYGKAAAIEDGPLHETIKKRKALELDAKTKASEARAEADRARYESKAQAADKKHLEAGTSPIAGAGAATSAAKSPKAKGARVHTPESDGAAIEGMLSSKYADSPKDISRKLGIPEGGRLNEALRRLEASGKIEVVKSRYGEPLFKLKTKSTKNSDGLDMTDEERTSIIDGLIANSCCWTEDDREELEGLTDNQLHKTQQAAAKATESEELLLTAEKGFVDGDTSINFNREKRVWEKSPQSKETETMAETTNQKQLTEEEWLAMAPESVKNSLDYVKEAEQKERKALVERITVNVAESDKPDKVASFAKKSLADLREIASLMPAPQTTNFYGPDFNGGNVVNIRRQKSNIDRNDVLEMPELDFVANSCFKK